MYIYQANVISSKSLQQVYEKSGRVGAAARTHSGVHVVALHPLRGHVMLARQFLTHEPSEDRNLAACLDSLMPGNILIAAAVVSWPLVCLASRYPHRDVLRGR